MKATMDDINEGLCNFIGTELAPGRRIRGDESLLESGILDSMAITRLLQFLEDGFGVTVPDEDFEPENFETVGTIAALVARRRRQTTLNRAGRSS